MSKEIAQTVGGKKLAFILAILAAFAVFAVLGSRFSSRASAQGLSYDVVATSHAPPTIDGQALVPAEIRISPLPTSGFDVAKIAIQITDSNKYEVATAPHALVGNEIANVSAVDMVSVLTANSSLSSEINTPTTFDQANAKRNVFGSLGVQSPVSISTISASGSNDQITNALIAVIAVLATAFLAILVKASSTLMIVRHTWLQVVFPSHKKWRISKRNAAPTRPTTGNIPRLERYIHLSKEPF